jgi:ABC-type branched-subunit amino acid transport system substrate-binding protein
MAGICLATAAAVPACDTVRSSPVTPAAGADCTTPGITENQVTLGLLYPDTGNASSLFLPFRAGVDARLGVANAAGGVNGRQVVYRWRDDESRPQANLAAAHGLVDTDQVFGIVESTIVASGSAEFLHSRGVPVTGASLETAWTLYDNMFSYSNVINDGPSVTTWGKFVADRGGQRAVITETSFSAASVSFARALKDSLEAAGIRVVDTIDVTSPVNFVDIGRRIKASRADVLTGAITGGSFGQVAAAARGVGADLRVILSPTGYDQSLLGLFRTALAGVFYFVDFLPFEMDTAAHRAFLDAMARFAPQMQPPNQQTALSGWLAADMFLRGLEAAGSCPTRHSFITGLRAVHDYDGRGLLPGPIDFGANSRKINLCYTFLRVSPDGRRFELVDPVPLCGSTLS